MAVRRRTTSFCKGSIDIGVYLDTYRNLHHYLWSHPLQGGLVTRAHMMAEPGSVGDVPFTKFLQSMPEKPDTTVRVFDRGDYYTAHGHDGLFVAKEVFGTTSVVKYLGPDGNRIPSVSMSKLKFEAFARELLLVKKYRLEIYCNKVKSGNNWFLAYKASPGNLQQLEDVIFSSNLQADSCVVMAIRLSSKDGQRVVGVAFSDFSSQELGVCQFVENDNFSNFESLLVQVGPKECLLVSKDTNAEAEILKKILQKANILITERKKSDFNSKDIVQDLNRLLKSENCSSLPELELSCSMESLSAVIKYLELLADERNFNSFRLSTFDMCRYMRLDTAAALALNVEAAPGENEAYSLVGVLNHCRTPQGQRLLKQWIKQPLIDLRHIVERQDLVELFIESVTLRQSVQDASLKILPDLFRLSKKLQQGKGTLQDCIVIYQAVQTLPTLIEGLTSYHGSHETLLKDMFITPLKDLEDDFVKYHEMIETTIDLDMIQHHEYLIKPSFDEELQTLRDSMGSIEEKMNVIYRKTASELSLEVGKNLKLENNSQLGYYMRLSKKLEKLIRGQKRFIVLDARNEGVRFTVSNLRTLSEEYQDSQRLYNQTQDRFAKEVIQIASGYTGPILVFNDLTAHIDSITSLAEAASSGPLSYVRPVMSERGTGDIVLVGARHPCLERQDDIAFIANDVALLRGKDEFQIITGPNMGGKSTYIRMIGVIVLMAQVGSFVPCTSANISIVDSILARVGAGDSQLKGVSTFMSEMLETATILKTATRNSLIIIDELGRGTSTYDGFGLAWAISQHIATRLCCFCLFATHFHELTSLSDSVPTVSNRHVTAIASSDNTLTLLYKVHKGVSDQSFGIQVAEMAHFPSEVISFARQKAAELELFYNKSEGSVDEPTAKKRRTEIKEGEVLIDSYLRRIDSLSLETMTDNEIAEQLGSIKHEIMNVDNSYLLGIIVDAKSDRMRSRRDKSRDKIKYTKLVDISGDTVDTYHDEQFTDSTPVKIPIRSIALATFLFLVGSVLLVLAGLLVGGVFGDTPDASAMPLLIIGALTFIPGFYHVRLAYYAWKGYYGYSFNDIPSYDD